MRIAMQVIALLVLVPACAAQKTTPHTGPITKQITKNSELTAQILSMTSSELWARQISTQSPKILAIVEAELGIRGESSTSFTYLGKRTSSVLGQALYRRLASKSGNKNCSDFRSEAEAQMFFLSSGGPLLDPNNLDRDGDGLACEWGTHIRKIVTNQGTSQVRSTSRPVYSACYTGPRGGTYTISASGKKNYNGC